MRQPRRILLVEDDPDEAKRSREALAESGYTVQTAASLASARRAVARGTRFDLVFVDQNLPDGEGLMLVPQLREAGLQAPVVLVTGNRSERVGEMAFRAGCADLAIKDLNYHLWLPQMAEAFIAAPQADDLWGPQVLGVCVGRLKGKAIQGTPAGLWTPLAPVLQAATDVAVQGLRATGHSLLGSLPAVHLQLQDDLHLLVVLRGGVFAAAILTQPPTARDRAEALAEAAAFSKARNQSGDEGAGTEPAA
jgi:CheY-like chemotaxis protein